MYNISVMVRVNLTDSEPVIYKPDFMVGIGLSCSSNTSAGNTVEMPPSMLPDNVTKVSVSTNESNAWLLNEYEQIVVCLGGDITPPVIENFNVSPNTSVSLNNPAVASAFVSDANLKEVWFGIVDSNDLSDTNMTVLGFYINESGVNGTYVAPPWYADAWNITNGTVGNIVTTLYHADWPDQILVFSWFKQNNTADEVKAISWFNNTTGELTNVTMDDDAFTPVTIQDGVSTFKVSTIKFDPHAEINGTTYTLYDIGNASNPNLVSMPVPSGTYEVVVHAWDAAGNENGTMVDIDVDNTPPVITGATANPPEIEANGTDNTLLNVTATDLHGIDSVSND
jgi:hypothetical protein